MAPRVQDVTWKHCSRLEVIDEENNPKFKLKCNYCGKIMEDRIFTMKHHLASTGKRGTRCLNATQEVRDMFSNLLADLRASKKKKEIDDGESYGVDEKEDACEVGDEEDNFRSKKIDMEEVKNRPSRNFSEMEEQFILRVPPSISERLERLFVENASTSEDGSLDLSFSEDGRSGTFVIGNERFPASLLDLPCVVESYKTYDDNVLIKTADIGQMIMVNEEGDPAAEGVEYKHGLTAPMKDARRRRFRREPDLNPELVQRVEKDLLNIMSGGTVDNVETAEPGANGDRKKAAPARAPKPEVVPVEAPTTGGEPDRSDSDDSLEPEN